MTLHINDLPDDCLRPILGQFSLNEQLCLRLTCCRWCDVVESILHATRILKIFSSLDNAAFYETTAAKYSLKKSFEGSGTRELGQISLIIGQKFRPINASLSHCLVRFFPSLHHLVVFCLHTVPNDLDLGHLLGHLPHLTSLTLFGLTKLPSGQQTQTLSAVAQLANLTRLHLFDLRNVSLPPVLLPHLSQLEHLTLHDYFTGDLIPVLNNLQSCTRLILDWIRCPWDQLEQCLPKLSPTLTHLTMGNFYPTGGFNSIDSVELFPFICRTFQRLEYLYLGFVLEIPLIQAAQHLSQLPRLSTLHLIVRSSALDNFNRLLATPLNTVTTLHLRRLCICLYKEPSTPANSTRISLGSLFPALEYLTVSAKCNKCVHSLGAFCFGDGLARLKQVQVHSE